MAISSVDGLVKDVMEIGSRQKSVQSEFIRVEKMILRSIEPIFSFDPSVNIELNYYILNDLELFVDVAKFERVISNIVSNAIEHMNREGRIVFSATHTENMIKLTIANNNSFIPSEKISKIFDAYYTSDKKGGTGLGLAIVKKIVEQHGGQVGCVSDQTTGTEFSLLMPGRVNTSQSSDIVLPLSSKSILKNIGDASGDKVTKCGASTNTGTETQLVIIFEDEKVFQRRWQKLFKDTSQCFIYESWTSFVDSPDHHDILAKAPFIVTDFYLKENETGLDVARNLRSQGWNGHIYLSSSVENSDLVNERIFEKILPKQPDVAYEEIVKNESRYVANS